MLKRPKISFWGIFFRNGFTPPYAAEKVHQGLVRKIWTLMWTLFLCGFAQDQILSQLDFYVKTARHESSYVLKTGSFC